MGVWWVRSATVAAFLCSTALFLVTMRADQAERDWSTSAMHAVHRFALSQRSLQRDLLNARVGILRNYDPINRDLDNARFNLERLAALSQDAETRLLIADATLRVAKQEMFVERFKTNNALLQNALASFTMADNRVLEGTSESQLATDILKLTLDTSPEAVAAARASIEGLSGHSAGAKHLRTNATLLLAVLPAVDQGLRELRALRLDERADRLRTLVSAESDARRTAVTRWIVGHIIFGVVTIALIAIWMVLLRLRNQHLQRLAETERMNATVANLLIDAQLFDGKGRLRRVLGQLADRLGADRAWLVISDATGEALSICWPETSEGDQPLFAQCANISTAEGLWEDDVLRLRGGELKSDRIAAILSQENVTDMLFMRGEEAPGVIIGFASKHRHLTAYRHTIGGLTAAFAAVRQALQRHLLAEERFALERKLAQSRRMEVIGAVATGVAHNFNNILGAISGFSEIAHGQTSPGSVVRQSLGEIQLAVSRAERVVEEILNFGRPASGKKMPIDLLPLMAEVSRMFDASGQGVRLKVELVSDPEPVFGNPDQLQQVVLNILNNAAQAVRYSGEIHLRLRTEHLRQPVEFSHSSLPSGPYIVIAVADQGPGIGLRNFPRLFEPFFTTRAAGTGLGLSTAWEVAVEHGGTIDVVTLEGVGSTFSLWLPVPRGAELTMTAAIRTIAEAA